MCKCRFCILPQRSADKVITEMFLVIISREYSPGEALVTRVRLSVCSWREHG